LVVGANANLVILDAPNVLEALRNHHAPQCVISNGDLVDRTKMEAIIQTGNR
jgi:hypothetical protein